MKIEEAVEPIIVSNFADKIHYFCDSTSREVISVTSVLETHFKRWELSL